MTNADFVSRVINGIRGLTKDDHISQRYVLSIGRTKATTYIAQKLEDRTIYREDNIQSHIPCLELKRESIVDCPIVEFRRCKILMKSKIRLPELIYSKYGASVFLVTTLDGLTKFDFITPASYSNLFKREFGLKGNKYTIQDGYLYILNKKIDAVNVSIVTLFDKEAAEACGCKKVDTCKSVWDYDFICPDKLLEPVIADTTNEVMGIWRRITPDENPNQDLNIKSQTIQ